MRRPIALVSLVDEHQQWFKANVGLPGVLETERGIAFCTHAIQNEGIFVVEDATAHKSFADNPLVRGHPFIRFYAGAPLRANDGHHIGTLCIIDRQPRELTPSQHSALLRLKRQVEIRLQLRLQLQEAQARNAELQECQLLRGTTGGRVLLEAAEHPERAPGLRGRAGGGHRP